MIGKVLSVEEIIIFKNTVANKALRGNSPQTPTQRLDCGAMRQCKCSMQAKIKKTSNENKI
ncbi:MAG: hypothetical protein RLZZ628_1851 [Bacteroidota bacterium]|jgi:hypothetical protein